MFQKINDVQEIRFDASGQMIKFPKIYVTSATRLKFVVQTPVKQYDESLQKISVRLDSVQNFIDVMEDNDPYNCLFKSNSDYKSLKDSLRSLNELLKSAVSCKGRNWKELTKEAPKRGLDKILPVSLYMKNLSNQYSVEILSGNIPIDTISLSLHERNCKMGCIIYESVTPRLSQMDKRFCLTNSLSELNFKLIYDDPWNKTIRQWYENKYKLFEEDALQEIRTGLDEATTISFSDSTSFKAALQKLMPLQKWFIHWFWLTGGRLAWDPLNQLTETQKKQKKALEGQLATVELEILQAKQQVKFLDSARIKTNETLPAFPDFKLVQLAEEKVADEIKQLEKKAKDLRKAISAGFDSTSFTTLSIMYDGKMRLSERGFKSIEGQYPHKQFDAAKNYQPIKYRFLQQGKVKEIPEGQQLQILTHNVPGGQGVMITERALPFKDEELFTSLINEQLSSFDFASIPTASVASMEAFLKPLRLKDGPGKKGANDESFSCDSLLQVLLRKLDAELKSKSVVFPPNPNLFRKIVRNEPKYKSHLTSTSIESGEAVIDSIFLKRYLAKDTLKTTTVAKTSVKIGQMRFFMLAAGIAIHRSPLKATAVDTTGGGLSTTTSETRSKAILGFKFYPFKNYNRDHSIIPRFPLRRFSMFFGVEMLKPLENLYLGASYDVVPGLNISVGQNYALETRYRIQNNTVTDTSKNYTKTGLYYSASINPILFVQFVKLFFK